MKRGALVLINFSLLIVILIGLPIVASMKLGGLAVSSIETRHILVTGGLALAVLWNGLVVVKLGGGRKERRTGWAWAFLFGALLLAELLNHYGVIHFEWLKDLIISVRDWITGR